jgi:hypothetical protein
MKQIDKGWLVVAVILLLVGYVWFVTFQDGNRILRRGQKDKEQEQVPYYSKENDGKERNP